MKNLVSFLFFLAICSAGAAQSRSFRVMSYNVENFFDCVDDSLTDDSEFLQGGMRGWNSGRYRTKQEHIAQVIVGVGEWEPPALVALCEVESERCLRDLTRYSGLKNLHYNYLHHESPDPRGIDVALLYQADKFRPVTERAIKVMNPAYPGSRTRDILYACGVTPAKDTLHVFVCHFPSRLGGELESEEKRIFAASVLKTETDRLQARNPRSNILIMGDFNDYPDNKSLSQILGAGSPDAGVAPTGLYNLMFLFGRTGKGSHKHDGEWGTLDQLIVSGTLLDGKGRMTIVPGNTRIFAADYLLEDDPKYPGKQPFRTYAGMKYQEGYSDHLPVYTDVKY